MGYPLHLPSPPLDGGAGAAQAAPGGARTCTTALPQAGSSQGAGGILRQLRCCGSCCPSFVRAQLRPSCPDPAPAETWRGELGARNSGRRGREGGSAPQRLGRGTEGTGGDEVEPKRGWEWQHPASAAGRAHPKHKNKCCTPQRGLSRAPAPRPLPRHAMALLWPPNCQKSAVV